MCLLWNILKIVCTVPTDKMKSFSVIYLQFLSLNAQPQCFPAVFFVINSYLPGEVKKVKEEISGHSIFLLMSKGLSLM